MKELPNRDNMIHAVCALACANEHAMRQGFEITGIHADPDSVGHNEWNQIHDYIDSFDNANKIYDACAAARRIGGSDVFYRMTSGDKLVGHILALHNAEGKINATFVIPA